jgi:hypothetical protein
MNKKDVLYYLSIVTIATFFLLMLYFVYLTTFDGSNALSYPNELMPATVTNGNVDVLITYCRTRATPFTAHVSFINGIVYNYPEETVAGNIVGCHTNHRLFTIPVELPSGTYQLNVQNTMKINALRSITAGYKTTPFVIQHEIETR